MSGLVWLVDGVIVFTVIEGLCLVVHHRRTGRGVEPGDFVANMLSGLCLMLALRAALGPGDPWPVLPALLAAGVIHGIDLWRRWRRG